MKKVLFWIVFPFAIVVMLLVDTMVAGGLYIQRQLDRFERWAFDWTNVLNEPTKYTDSATKSYVDKNNK